MRGRNENQAQYTPLLNACYHTYAILSKIERKRSKKFVISGTLLPDFILNFINLMKRWQRVDAGTGQAT
jgi:hypothetical protein